MNTTGYDIGRGIGLRYQDVAASQTKAQLGAVGDIGDWLDEINCVVTTAATSAVSIQDGPNGASIQVFPNNPGGGVGTYNVRIHRRATSKGGWLITTGAGVAVMAAGNFT